MGRLTAELPGGLIHSWIGRDKATVDDFLRRFRHRLEEHVRHDAEVQQAAQGQPPDAVLRRWVYGMLRHVLATPWPTLRSTFDFRRMFVTYVLLIREVEVPEYPGSYGDHLPDHDLEFKLAVLDGAVANVTSISLTAGDWTVNGSIYYTPTGTTQLYRFMAGSNSTSPTLPAIPFYARFEPAGTITGVAQCLVLPEQRYSLSATATIYLVTQAGFLTTTLQDTGHIHARRMR